MHSENLLLSQLIDRIVPQDGSAQNWQLEVPSKRNRERWMIPGADGQFDPEVGWQVVDRDVSIARVYLGRYLVEVLLVFGAPMNDDEISLGHG